jgi:hypothetical protein
MRGRPSGKVSRRRFLEIGATGLASLSSGTLLWPTRTRAAGTTSKYFVLCNFAGGWDQLLVLDPRDNTLPQFQRETAYLDSGSGIHVAYDYLTDPDIKAVLAANPSGIQKPTGTTSSPLSFGPAMPPSLMAHWQDMAVIRGFDMGSLEHSVAARYFLTGIFPQGLQAKGSSLPTVVTSKLGDKSDVPHLSVYLETYNQGLPPFASGLPASYPSSVEKLLKPAGTALPSGSSAALAVAESNDDTCAAHELNATGLVSLFRSSRTKARQLMGSQASSYFNWLNPTPETQQLLTHFGITDLARQGAKMRAAIAAQAISKGVSQVVAVTVQGALDNHFDWTDRHAGPLREGLDAVGKLISWLKNAPDPDGGSVFDHTTIFCISEFARAPLLWNFVGRDHHMTSSCFVMGPGVKGNTVAGASTDVRMSAQPMELLTGQPGTGVSLRPPDIHATVLASMGLSYEHLSNVGPQILRAILK